MELELGQQRGRATRIARCASVCACGQREWGPASWCVRCHGARTRPDAFSSVGRSPFRLGTEMRDLLCVRAQIRICAWWVCRTRLPSGTALASAPTRAPRRRSARLPASSRARLSISRRQGRSSSLSGSPRHCRCQRRRRWQRSRQSTWLTRSTRSRARACSACLAPPRPVPRLLLLPLLRPLLRQQRQPPNTDSQPRQLTLLLRLPLLRSDRASPIRGRVCRRLHTCIAA
jgi:hypothetical protein